MKLTVLVDNHTLIDRYYLGEAPELRGYWVAAGYNSIGIVSSGGAGMAFQPVSQKLA